VLWCHLCVPSQPPGSHGESQLSSDATVRDQQVFPISDVLGLFEAPEDL
jgi:hypothetical protein